MLLQIFVTSSLCISTLLAEEEYWDFDLEDFVFSKGNIFQACKSDSDCTSGLMYCDTSKVECDMLVFYQLNRKKKALIESSILDLTVWFSLQSHYVLLRAILLSTYVYDVVTDEHELVILNRRLIKI